jgi:hypothetical protein
MSGGDFKNYNRRFKELKEEYGQIKDIPAVFVKSDIVSDNERRENHSISKEMHSTEWDKCNQVEKKAYSLRNDIKDSLRELQTADKGGKLEIWENNQAEIDSIIEGCKTKKEKMKKYL